MKKNGYDIKKSIMMQKPKLTTASLKPTEIGHVDRLNVNKVQLKVASLRKLFQIHFTNLNNFEN